MFIISDQTGIIAPLIQSIGLFPQHMSPESPKSSFNSLLALRIRVDTACPSRHTTSKAYTTKRLAQLSHHPTITTKNIILPSSPPKNNPPAVAKK